MKAIWTEDEAAYHGELVDFDPIWSWPKPVQEPHPPILVGGNSDGALRPRRRARRRLDPQPRDAALRTRRADRGAPAPRRRGRARADPGDLLRASSPSPRRSSATRTPASTAASSTCRRPAATRSMPALDHYAQLAEEHVRGLIVERCSRRSPLLRDARRRASASGRSRRTPSRRSARARSLPDARPGVARRRRGASPPSSADDRGDRHRRRLRRLVRRRRRHLRPDLPPTCPSRPRASSRAGRTSIAVRRLRPEGPGRR